ncbi:DUF6356 family protein [Sphingobium sp.]|uniref:DUF6356 family protein n=1 Tax=Sphingobium sp. TaxID=1912891 RepID=UPI0028BEF2C9|nr:DUF6356 family protein [Sphingobium sp.]
MFRKIFLDHPASVYESYFDHMRSTFGFSWTLASAALACFIHGLLPFLHQQTASNRVKRLHDRIVVHRKNPR